uniref:uncharacterized protein n=1 Tax=Myxine glutinosa TaxID=7769 RepID=UPI00358E27B6
MGSPFEEESTDLLVLGTLEILGPAVVDTVCTAVQIGRDQFHSFEKERKGIRRRVTGSALLPGNWHSFLRVDENKEELFSFLSKQVTESIDVPDKQLIATDGEQVIAVPPCADTAALAPCNHEEADTRMMLHAAAAMKSGHRRVLIRTVDTDVVVLAVWMAQELNEVVDELWLALGTGKNFRYIAAHELSATLGQSQGTANLPCNHRV